MNHTNFNKAILTYFFFPSTSLTDLCFGVVLVVPGRSTTDPAIGAFAITPDPCDWAGCTDSAAAL